MYKYLPSERIDILENNLICFNNPLNFNDPFEFNTSFNFDSFESNLYDSLKTIDLFKELPTELLTLIEKLPNDTANNILEEAKRSMLSIYQKEKENIIRTTENTMQGFNSKLIEMTRILSLTETPTNILMWGHYAQAHSGFVIEFDTNHPFFSQHRSHKDEFGYLRKVIYQKEYPVLDPLSDGQINHFLIKSKDWEYEREWRILLPQANSIKTINVCEKEFDLYEIPSDSIKTIIFGCNTSEQFKNKTFKLINSRTDYEHISFRQAKKSNSRFEIELEPL
ncbi:DUF2971 domain-containing protein [Enterobacter kobei]|uniref:DUF2971 domain-containing protein n=1 Tax=Enterobacter kobei TaxID=208224 RepID=A0AAW3XE16_9ENTR|nr:DUF2971 domain-containing protein [Enterobacter kobei]KJM88492.1 hypothetical protein SS33_16110 [Enterobacter kobei]MBC6322225.1 DUF2971 domain-containing protein [Enterobacter kobei]MBG0682103.1 DUF2971 domain-containing protein [Enterobacter kobei]MBW4188617.1 DUF2971 domain-containing protein [Enterobacter kobei]MCU2428474.1 DUF2971 domain-containing protein [Enterobacter kobei]